MTVEEELKRIADASEKKNQYIADVGDLAWGLMKGVLIGVVIIAVFFLLLIFGGGIYDFFAYDVLGYDRPSYTVGIADVGYTEVKRYEPTLDDQMMELSKLAYRADEKFVQDIYKNCVFAIKIMLNDNVESYEIMIDDYSSNRTCYQSMKNEIVESWEKTKQIMKDVREISFLTMTPDSTKSEDELK